jgi:hypothetical protein
MLGAYIRRQLGQPLDGTDVAEYSNLRRVAQRFAVLVDELLQRAPPSPPRLVPDPPLG